MKENREQTTSRASSRRTPNSEEGLSVGMKDDGTTLEQTEIPMPMPAEKRAGGKRRFAELDFIRGICVILMIFDHFMFDLAYIFTGSKVGEAAMAFETSSFRLFWHYTVIFIFLLLCGISCSLSRSNFKRGLLCFGAACFLTWGTWMLGTTAYAGGGDYPEKSGLVIVFGVLHMLGAAMLIFALLDVPAKLMEKKIGRAARALPAAVGLVILILYFAFIFEEVRGEFFMGKVYKGPLGHLPAIIGYDTGLASADYFPLLPYICIVLIGSIIGEFVYRGRERSLLPVLEHKAAAPVNFVGRHALIFYICHQIVLSVLLGIIYIAIYGVGL